MSTSPLLLPCLAFHRAADRSTVLFSASKKQPIVGGDIGELENKIICPTTHGFMLARDPGSLATFLWNPQSHGKIDLPPLGLEVEDDLLIDCTCLLSEKPTAPDCVVLLVQPDVSLIWYCSCAGDSQWTKHEYDIGTQLALPEWDLPEEKVLIHPIAACRGKFYYGTPCSLGVIDMSPAPVFSTIDDISDTIDESYEGGGVSLFFVESEDDLYMVSLFYPDNVSEAEPYGAYTHATVHRMDFSKQHWCQVDHLGDRVFLLSPYEFGGSCSGGKAGLQHNCVYFVDPCRNTLQLFNLNDGSKEVQKLDDAPVSAKSFWVLPTDL